MLIQATFRELQWLFPIAATLHNIEEFIWLPGFVAEHAAEFPWRVDPGVGRFALVVLTLAAWIVTHFSGDVGEKRSGHTCCSAPLPLCC